MIILKSKIHKAEFLRKCEIYAFTIYLESHEKELSTDQFMAGVEYTLKELQLNK